MEVTVDENELKAAGARSLTDGRRGVRIRGWEIETRKRPILSSSTLEQWEQKLGTSHFPEMIFGNSLLILKHLNSGIILHFNAFDALTGWKEEALPPVEVPAAAKWKFRSKPFQQVILDYDYTFTTPYSGSGGIEMQTEHKEEGIPMVTGSTHWEDCEEQIDLIALAVKEPILFYDEVILYEDELADNGVSLLTVKVRVMPSSWFLLLRFWVDERTSTIPDSRTGISPSLQGLGIIAGSINEISHDCNLFGARAGRLQERTILRVDGVLMRLRDTRMHCVFQKNENPAILREICWREGRFDALSAKGYPSDPACYNDPSIVGQRLTVVMHKTQKLVLPGNS